jgi:hypothetical protein
MAHHHNSPVDELGKYVVTGEIAEGTFGKVKSTLLSCSVPVY